MKKLRIMLTVVLAVYTSTQIIAQQKIPIKKADELPTRSVTLVGKATEIIEDLDQLNELVRLYNTRLEEDLEKYDIQDKATLKAYYGILASNYMFQKNYTKALTLVNKMRELQDKENEKLTTGLYLKSFNKAYQTNKNVQSEEFKKIFKTTYSNFWQELPYDVVKNQVEAQRGSLSIFNPALVTASLDDQLQPFLDNNKNVVPEAIISSFVNIRLLLDDRQHLIPAMLEVLNDLYEKNHKSVEKIDIWASRDVKLTKKNDGSPVVVAIWDSGTDINVFDQNQLHFDQAGKNGVGYSLIDYKQDGLLLDNPEDKIQSDLKELQTLTKGFMDLQAGIESEEVMNVRQKITNLKKEEAEAFQEELAFYGNYAHGTHVAGIALKDNPFAKLLVARMGFEYRSLPPAHTKSQAKFQAKMYSDVVDYFKENNVRVVNMSWRYGVSSYEGILALNGIGKNDEDRKKIARKLFEIEKKALYEAIKSAPEILFICGSGNEANDAGFVEYIPASLELPNLITVGAVDNEGKKTSFTTEGKSVRFYANGFEVESFVPGGAKVKFSGTSMASPNVANLAAKILALAPELSPKEVINLIEKGSDNLPENEELSLINPKNTLKMLDGKIGEVSSIRPLLLRKWKPDEKTATLMVANFLEEMHKQNPDQAQAMSNQKALLQQLFSQTVFEYRNDGNLVINLPNNPEQTGKFELLEEESKIKTFMSGKTEIEIIKTLTANKLITLTEKGNQNVYLAVD